MVLKVCEFWIEKFTGTLDQTNSHLALESGQTRALCSWIRVEPNPRTMYFKTTLQLLPLQAKRLRACFSYAKPEILKAYVLLAADFEKNSAHANHCVVKMLHRIGFDLGFMGMLFQASLFQVFQRLMHGALARSARFQVRCCIGVDAVLAVVFDVLQCSKNFVLTLWTGR